jgi:hypothetical protein
MAPLAVAIKSNEGVYSPQQYRSPEERFRHDELKKPRLTPQQEIVTVNNLVYEPTYRFELNGIAVASYTPDFVYEEKIYKFEEIEEQESPDQFCLDSFERIERILSRKKVAEDVKGRIIEPHSILKMQILVALNADIDEGRIVQTGSKGSEISDRFTKDQFLIQPKPTSLTQAANSSKSEIEKISEIKQILLQLPPFLTLTALRSRLKEPDFATQVASSRIISLNSSEELWVNALQKAKENGLILNFWVKPKIYPDLGNVRIFLEPYVPLCIYETKRGELVLIDVKHSSITKEDWIKFNVTKVLLKDVIKIFKTYLKTILIEEWSRDLPGKMGVKPRKPPKVDPYWDLARVSFWDSLK